MCTGDFTAEQRQMVNDEIKAALTGPGVEGETKSARKKREREIKEGITKLARQQFGIAGGRKAANTANEIVSSIGRSNRLVAKEAVGKVSAERVERRKNIRKKSSAIRKANAEPES